MQVNITLFDNLDGKRLSFTESVPGKKYIRAFNGHHKQISAFILFGQADLLIEDSKTGQPLADGKVTVNIFSGRNAIEIRPYS